MDPIKDILQNIADTGQLPPATFELTRKNIFEIAVGLVCAGAVIIMIWAVARKYSK